MWAAKGTLKNCVTTNGVVSKVIKPQLIRLQSRHKKFLFSQQIFISLLVSSKEIFTSSQTLECFLTHLPILTLYDPNKINYIQVTIHTLNLDYWWKLHIFQCKNPSMHTTENLQASGVIFTPLTYITGVNYTKANFCPSQGKLR